MLSHSSRQIETHPSRTLTNDARRGENADKKAQLSPPNVAEYASPLLLYTPSPSMIRTNASYADPQRLRRMQNFSQQQQQQHHSLQHNHQLAPNWEEFFPPPPPPPQQQQHQEQQEASVACYASTEICKVQSELRYNAAIICRNSYPAGADVDNTARRGGGWLCSVRIVSSLLLPLPSAKLSK